MYVGLSNWLFRNAYLTDSFHVQCCKINVVNFLSQCVRLKNIHQPTCHIMSTELHTYTPNVYTRYWQKSDRIGLYTKYYCF